MSQNTYEVGDRPTLRGGFANRALKPAEVKAFRAGGPLPAGTGVNPGAVVCTVRKPDGTSVEVLAVGASGVYTAEITVDQAGTWHYAFDGTGGYQASGERSLKVLRQQVPRVP